MWAVLGLASLAHCNWLLRWLLRGGRKLLGPICGALTSQEGLIAEKKSPLIGEA